VQQNDQEVIEGELTILQMHLYRRSIRRFTHPQVQILSFSSLKEEDIVAIVQLCQFVQLVQL